MEQKFDEAQQKIVNKIKDSDPKASATQVIATLKDILIKKYLKDHPSYSYKDAESIVEDEQLSPSAVTRYLATDYKKHRQMLDMEGLDRPWNMAALKYYKVSNDATLHIMEVHTWAKQQIAKPEADWLKQRKKPTPVTIRQAIWISRLQPLIGKLDHKMDSWLWTWSKIYSLAEIEHTMLGKKGPFDSTKIDEALMAIPPAKATVIDDVYYISTESGRFMGIADLELIERIVELEKKGIDPQVKQAMDNTVLHPVKLGAKVNTNKEGSK